MIYTRNQGFSKKVIMVRQDRMNGRKGIVKYVVQAYIIGSSD